MLQPLCRFIRHIALLGSLLVLAAVLLACEKEPPPPRIDTRSSEIVVPSYRGANRYAAPDRTTRTREDVRPRSGPATRAVRDSSVDTPSDSALTALPDSSVESRLRSPTAVEESTTLSASATEMESAPAESRID